MDQEDELVALDEDGHAMCKCMIILKKNHSLKRNNFASIFSVVFKSLMFNIGSYKIRTENTNKAYSNNLKANIPSKSERLNNI